MYQGQLVCQRPQRSWQHTRPAAFPASLFYRRQGLWRFGEKKVRMAGLTRQPGSAPAAGFTPPVVCRPVKPCFSLHMKKTIRTQRPSRRTFCPGERQSDRFGAERAEAEHGRWSEAPFYGRSFQRTAPRQSCTSAGHAVVFWFMGLSHPQAAFSLDKKLDSSENGVDAGGADG